MPTIAEQVRKSTAQFELERERENTQRALQGQEPLKSTAERVRERMTQQRVAASQQGLGPEVLGATSEGLDAPTRAKMSLLADTPEERQGVFVNKFPQGTLTTNPATGEEIFRKTGEGGFSKVDPGLSESFARGIGPGLKEVGRDIADIAGEIPSIVTEGAALLATKGAGILGRTAATGVGGGLGEAARQGLKAAAGTQQGDLKTRADRVVGAIIEGAAGGLAGDVGAAGVNLVRKTGLLGVPPEAGKAIRAASRLDVPGLLPNQVTDNPIVRRAGGQAAALLPSIARYVANQERRLVAAVRGIASPRDRAQLISRGVAEHEQASRDIVQQALRSRTSVRTGGRALQQGISAWEKASQKEVGSLYGIARKIEEPVFDITSLKEVAQRIKIGTQAQTEAGGTVRVSAISPELERVADDILSLDPNLPPVTLQDGSQFMPTDQLRELSKRLHDLTLVGPEGKREPQFIAGRLFGAIKDVLNNPIGGGPEFISAWKQANKAAQRRFKTREQLAVVNAVKSETPTQLAARLAQPEQLDNLVVLRKILPPEKWVKFRESFKTSLIDGDLTKRLDSFDQPTINTLLSKEEQRLFRDAGRQLDRMNASGFDAARLADESTASFADSVISTKDPLRVAGLRDAVRRSGGKDSELGRSVRAGIIDSLLRRATTVKDGITTIDHRALSSILEDLGPTGLLRLLKSQELQVLKDVRLVQSFTRQGADAGTSLQAASAVAGLREFSGKALDTLLENLTVGRIMTSNVGRQILTGVGEKVDERLAVRLLALAASDLAVSNEQAAELSRVAQSRLF